MGSNAYALQHHVLYVVYQNLFAGVFEIKLTRQNQSYSVSKIKSGQSIRLVKS